MHRENQSARVLDSQQLRIREHTGTGALKAYEETWVLKTIDLSAGDFLGANHDGVRAAGRFLHRASITPLISKVKLFICLFVD